MGEQKRRKKQWITNCDFEIMGEIEIIGHFEIMSDFEIMRDFKIMGCFDLWVTFKPTHK